MKRRDVTLFVTMALNFPLVALGAFVLYRELSLATTIAFALLLTGPLAAIGFVITYRRSLKVGRQLRDKYFKKISISGNSALILSVIFSYAVYGFAEYSFWILPLAVISTINMVVALKPAFLIGKMPNAS
ncbi:hypothetical protein [Nitrogeniibacter aestuarii]|uniref:hypothetical protein n=1 Tax=Nitrogeniibacter aestuarii TaxID=2815343 RepID=UPI001D125E46|nr:hypothetical protein [Nitrogeniibacter aestuarii]